MGLVLAFGVLLDTFVIRTIVVPTVLALWPLSWPGRRKIRAARDGTDTQTPVA